MLEFPKQYIIDLHVKINEIDNIARFLLKRKFQNYFLVSLWDFCNDYGMNLIVRAFLSRLSLDA